jgi:hypothetical protein
MTTGKGVVDPLLDVNPIAGTTAPVALAADSFWFRGDLIILSFAPA